MQVVVKDMYNTVKTVKLSSGKLTEEVNEVFIVLNGVPTWVHMNEFDNFVNKWGDLEEY